MMSTIRHLRDTFSLVNEINPDNISEDTEVRNRDRHNSSKTEMFESGEINEENEDEFK